MMLMFLAKRRLSSPRIHLLLPAFFSSASLTPNPDPKTPTFAVADYLISSFGFSPDKASKVSKRLARFSSPEKLDSVCRLLQDQGFSDSDVKRLVTSYPDILRSSLGKTLDPNLRALRDMGLSTSTVNQIILTSPQALQLQSTVPRIRFWMDFFDGDEAALVKAFKRNRRLVSHDIARVVSPKISFLRTQGFSTQEIRMIVSKVPRFITGRISGMEDLLKRTEELGFHPESPMFLLGLKAMICSTREVLEKKIDFLKSFGWSEKELVSALLKSPLLLTLSEENLQAKMDFLLGETRCAASYIKSHPGILTYSLGKRLRPRNNVMHLLESKGISVKGRDFLSDIQLTNNEFVERYIIPHKDEISGLHETYLAACA